MKRVFSIIMAILISVPLIFFVPNKAYGADATVNITLTTNTNSVIVGQNVEVTINISANMEMLFAEFLLNYDSSKFDFVSGDELGGSAYAGVIPYNMDYPINMNAIGQPTSYQYKVVLRAKTTTDATDITVSDVVVTGCDTNIEEHYLTPVVKNVTGIKVWAQGSDDATLSTLQVAGFPLNPGFGKWTTDYIVYVDHNTTAVDIVAQASQAAMGGRVEISGHMTDLAFGNNYVTVKSYAPNGKVITYNINIYRLDPPTEPPTTEPPTEPPAWSEVVVDGISYNISADFTAEMIPAGFNSTLYDYKGNETLAVTNDKLSLDLLYLVDGEKNGKFFIYDKEVNKFYPYIVINSYDNSYVVLPNEVAEKLPTDSKDKTFLIGEQQINGLVDNEDEDFLYFYGINQSGEYNWYCYDSLEGTIQRFHSVSVEVPTNPEEGTTIEPSQESMEGTTNNNYASENESLHAANDNLIKIRNIALAVAVVLFIVLIGLVIFLIAHKSEEKHSDNTEKVDYVKLEKEEEKSETGNEEEIASVYEAAILKQMAATKEEESVEEGEDEDEEIDEILEDEDVDADIDDTLTDDAKQPEIISLDDEELL